MKQLPETDRAQLEFDISAIIMYQENHAHGQTFIYPCGTAGSQIILCFVSLLT